MKDKNIIVRVTKEQKDVLKELAKAHNITLTELLLKNVKSNIYNYQTIIK